MPRTGTFGGFVFDPEVFSDYMQQRGWWKNEIIASGIVRQDATIMDLIGEKGNVATLPFYNPIDVYEDEPLNNDGLTDNTPIVLPGGKQTAMLIQRMKAFKAQDFTKELTGADPLGNIASKIAEYYQQVWQRELMNISLAVMKVGKLTEHVTDITGIGTGKADETSLLFAEQAALGDGAGDGYGLIVMHSFVYANYQAMKLVEYEKYSVPNALEREVTLPTIGGKIVLVNDRGTVSSDAEPKFYTYMFGEGAFLSANKTNYENPNYTDYDPETTAGVEKLYTKQGRVLHPNGLSLNVTNITNESPTYTELGTSANWSLEFNHRNVRIGMLVSKG